MYLSTETSIKKTIRKIKMLSSIRKSNQLSLWTNSHFHTQCRADIVQWSQLSTNHCGVTHKFQTHLGWNKSNRSSGDRFRCFDKQFKQSFMKHSDISGIWYRSIAQVLQKITCRLNSVFSGQADQEPSAIHVPKNVLYAKVYLKIIFVFLENQIQKDAKMLAI